MFPNRTHANGRMRFPVQNARTAVLALVACGLTPAADAVDGAQPFVLPDAEVIALPQTSANGNDYILYVGFPLSYDTAGPTRRYPVIYVCDGYWDFPLAASVADFVRRDGHAPEALVVGIGYGGANPNVGLLRQWDLTPGVDPVYDAPGERTGHADEFLEVIATEIIPFVEANYRADPSHRVLVGSSFGGLFVTYAAFARPGLFRGIVASSPSLDWRDEYPLSLAREHAASGSALSVRIYLGWGSGDHEDIVASATHFAQEVAALGIRGLRLAAREVEGGGHNGTKPENFTRGLRFVFAPQAWEPTVGLDPGYGQLGRLINLSTRGHVEGGERVLIGGLVVDGILPKRLLIRAAGPALAPLGVSGVLANPRFRVVNQDGVTVAENDDWGDAPDQEELQTAQVESGAFSFAAGSRDAAVIAHLAPGIYTIVVESVDGTDGVALVEAFELAP